MGMLDKLFKPSVEHMKARGDVEGLIKALKNKKWIVREEATRALGEIKDVRAVEPLIQALKDEDSSVRESAAKALWEIGDARAVEPLIQALRDKEMRVRKAAMWCLGSSSMKWGMDRIGDAKTLKPLIQALKDDNLRWEAKLVLKEIGKPALKALIQASRDKDSRLRAEAREALGEIEDTSAVEALIQALKDEDSGVRESAAEALREIEDARAVEPLIQALKGKDSYVRREAAWALNKIGDARAVEALVEACRQNEDVRWIAALSLWELGGPAAIEDLRTIEPPTEVKSRRKLFSEKFPDIVKHLEAMPIVGENECDLALQSNPNIELATKARRLSKWGRANKSEIIDVLSVFSSRHENSPYGGLEPLQCERAELIQKPISASIELSIISVVTESTERHDGYYTWDSWRGGELHVLRTSEEEYRYFFDGGFVAGNVDEYVKYTIPKTVDTF